jgi:uncharacterized membrane protein
MMLAPLTIGIVLLAALLHALWNVLIKRSDDGLLTQASIFGFGSLLCVAPAMYFGFPEPASWGFLFLGVLIHNAYFFSLLQAYRLGDLSHVYPLARGCAPLMVALFSAILVDPSVSPLGESGLGKLLGHEQFSVPLVIGVGLISLGIVSLALDRALLRKTGAMAAMYAVCTGLFITAYTMVDALGVRQNLASDGTALSFIFWLQTFSGVPLTIVALVRRREDLGRVNVRRIAEGIGGGTMAIASYSLVLWAYSQGALVTVAALRETSVVFAAILGATLLGEPFGLRRVRAAVLVAAGIIVFNLPAQWTGLE